MILPTPEFAKRAKDFINDVEEVTENDRGRKNHAIRFTVEEFLPRMIESFDKLQTLIDASNSVEDRTAGHLADKLDQDSVDMSIVEVSAVYDSYHHLHSIVQVILFLAERYGGEIDSSQSFSTTDQENYISTDYYEGVGTINRVQLYFQFQ